MFLSKYQSIEKNMSFDGKTIQSSDTVDLLGIILDKNTNFKQHIHNIGRKANNKTKAVLCIKKFLKLELVQVFAEACISSNFRSCPLIWMFCGKMRDNLPVKIHYRMIRAINDTQNLQILLVELYKCLNKISPPPFTWDYLKEKNNSYHLRNMKLLELTKCRRKMLG